MKQAQFMQFTGTKTAGYEYFVNIFQEKRIKSNEIDQTMSLVRDLQFKKYLWNGEHEYCIRFKADMLFY